MYVKLEWFTGIEYAHEWVIKYSKRYYDLIRDYDAEEVNE